ncbi:MAG: EVE domain-containing protein, partial [Gemmataceae bacterium]
SVGDEVLYYHTGKVKAVVGIAKVVSGPTPVEPGSTQVTVNLAAIRALKVPVTLATIKADERFAEWELVRQARLSVMPVPEPLWRAVVQMGSGK